MKAQFKYALRSGLTVRLAVLGFLVLLSAVFGLLATFRHSNEVVETTAVVLISIGLSGVFVVNVIMDFISLKGIFGAPEGYLNALTPVKFRVTLFARTVCAVLEDCAALGIGTLCVLWHALLMDGMNANMAGSIQVFASVPEIVQMSILVLFGYTFIFMLIVFGRSLRHSVFFGMHAKPLLTALGVGAAIWVLSLLNFALAPFGVVEHVWWVIYSIIIPVRSGVAGYLYALVALFQIVVLFIANSMLMERRMNLS